MNSVVIYYTQFGTTKTVAETIAERLGSAGPARTLPVDEMPGADLSAVDLVVMGTPTHYQSLPKDVRTVLKAVPKRALRGKRVAAFDTSLKMWGPIMRLTAAHWLLPRLRKLGGKRFVRPETFVVETSPSEDGDEEVGAALVDGELAHARAWAATILERLDPQGRRGL